MALDDEAMSSLVDVGQSITLVTFIGFQEHLLMNFLKTFIGNGVKEVLLFSGSLQMAARERQVTVDIELRKKAIHFIRDSLGEGVSIVLIEFENIWDFQDYYIKLSQRPIKHAIINISAGPAVFSAAGMVWALEFGHKVSYSIEYHNNGKLVSSVFSMLDLKPYINSIFSTDNVDKMIMGALRKEKYDTLQIYRYINDDMGYTLSLRSVEIHLEKLSKLGVVDITKGRVNRISFSQNWSKIGSMSRR